jgi:hypothetical protein
MKRNTKEYNALQNYRYTVTTACNVFPRSVICFWLHELTSGAELEYHLQRTHQQIQSHFNVIIDSPMR